MDEIDLFKVNDQEDPGKTYYSETHSPSIDNTMAQTSAAPTMTTGTNFDNFIPTPSIPISQQIQPYFSEFTPFLNGKINQVVATQNKFRMQPPKYSGHAGQDSSQWINYYERSCRVNSWLTDAEKARYLPCFLDSAAQIWYDNLEHTATAAELASYTFLKAAILKAFDIQRTADTIEFTLRTRKMAPDESVSTYYHSMLNLCRRSNPQMSNEAIVRHLTFGLRPELMKHIMLMENTNAEQFYKNATKVERAIQITGHTDTELTDITDQLKKLTTSVADLNIPPKINVIRSYAQYNHNFSSSDNGNDEFQFATSNTFNSDFDYKQNIQCHFCGKMGHIRPKCYSMRRLKEQELQYDTGNDLQETFDL